MRGYNNAARQREEQQQQQQQRARGGGAGAGVGGNYQQHQQQQQPSASASSISSSSAYYGGHSQNHHYNNNSHQNASAAATYSDPSNNHNTGGNIILAPPPPPPSSWIRDCLVIASQHSPSAGGAIAQMLHQCSSLYKNVAHDPALLAEVEKLPVEVPTELLRSVAAQLPAGGLLALVGPLEKIVYALCRSFLRGYVLFATKSAERAQELFDGYQQFAEFHQQDRGGVLGVAGIAGSSAPLTKQQLQQQHNVGWDTPILVVVVQHMRRAINSSGASLEEDRCNDISRAWRNLFTTFLVRADPAYPNNVARRRGALVVFNAMLSIYFHKANFSQVKTLLDQIDALEKAANGDPTKGVLGPCGHIKSEVTKLLYFQGRYRLLQPQAAGVDIPVVRAAKLFAECCSRMPPLGAITSHPFSSSVGAAAAVGDDEVRNNKLRSIFYVCIASLLSGVAPDPVVLAADPFISDIVSPLLDAVNAGSPNLLAKLLSENRSQSSAVGNMRFSIGAVLRTRGVFILVQQHLHLQCILSVVKRVHGMVRELGFDNSRLHLSLLERTSELFDEAAMPSASSISSSSSSKSPAEQLKEVEGRGIDTSFVMALAQLIARGYIKGYIAYDCDTMVLSKADPFPRLLV